MVADHRDYVKLLRELKDIPGVKKVFIRSGIRFDYVLADKDQTFLSELVKDHISGQLRVAPEHVSNRVLSYMGKPRHEVYQEFIRRFDACNKKTGKQQYALPYFMSSHPGCDLEDAVELAEYIRDMGFIPEQAQDFYPTPSTLVDLSAELVRAGLRTGYRNCYRTQCKRQGRSGENDPQS